MSRLADEIKKYQESFKKRVPLEVQKIMLEATQKLKNEKLSKNALKVGDTAKEIKLLNAVKKEISLYDLLQENKFVVINFYRGGWCPYCNLELKGLQDKIDEFTTLGAKLVAISPQSPDASLSTKEKDELTFEVLSDPKNKIAKEYGLVFSLNDELRPIYKDFDIPGHNEEESFELPMPATYVVDKNKKIIFSYVDEDYTKRSEPQDIVDAIKKHS